MRKLMFYAFLICLPFMGVSQTEIVEQSNDWQFKITPNAWLIGIQGDMSLNNSGELDPVFSDAMDPLNITGGITIEVKKGKWGINLDAFYASISKDGYVMANYSEIDLENTVNGDFNQTFISLGGSYSFAKVDNFTLDVLFGGRYYSANSKITGGSLINALYDDNINFIDPYIGLAFNNDWNKFSLGGSIDVGGFGFGSGSEISYKYSMLVGYQITDVIGLDLGYKAYQPLYEEQDFSYNLATQGFFAGFSFSF